MTLIHHRVLIDDYNPRGQRDTIEEKANNREEAKIGFARLTDVILRSLRVSATPLITSAINDNDASRPSCSQEISDPTFCRPTFPKFIQARPTHLKQNHNEKLQLMWNDNIKRERKEKKKT